LLELNEEYMNSYSVFLKSYLGAVLFAAVFAGGAHLVFADGASTAVTVGNAVPSVSAVAIVPSTITLTENATTSVTITATITDGNGCDTVFASGSIVATLYRSGVGSACSANDNNCYRSIALSEVGATCSGGSDTSGDASGTVALWYHADATDASSTYPTETWVADVKAIDFENASSTASSTAELNSLYALNVTASISYGTLAANADTGATNQLATTTNTGNYKLDIEFSGTDMTDGGVNTIVAAQQKYSTTSATYASLAFTLSTSPASQQVNIVKATASSTPSTQTTYWGIAIPSGKPAGSYTGTNTFTAIYSAD
jgi:hypothetical protein